MKNLKFRNIISIIVLLLALINMILAHKCNIKYFNDYKKICLY